MKLTLAVFLRASEKPEVPLIWRAAAMPEEQPLHELTLLKFILESKVAIFVPLEEVEKFCRALHDGEGRRLRVVDKKRDSA